MTRGELSAAVDALVTQTHDALQLLWNNINKGQRKQLAKRPEIAALLERYGVEADT